MENNEDWFLIEYEDARIDLNKNPEDVLPGAYSLDPHNGVVGGYPAIQKKKEMEHFMMAPRKIWETKEKDDALHIRIDVPGLSKKHLNFYFDKSGNKLIIKGAPTSNEGDEGSILVCKMNLPPSMYKIDHVKAQMKNGVLKIIVPKIVLLE